MLRKDCCSFACMGSIFKIIVPILLKKHTKSLNIFTCQILSNFIFVIVTTETENEKTGRFISNNYCISVYLYLNFQTIIETTNILYL